MLSRDHHVRHVVAGLTAVRWSTCGVLWLVVATSRLLPGLDVSLTDIWPLVLAAAICRTAVALLPRWEHVDGLRGLSLTCDVVLLTGLLDITGGPYNPFIVMYAVYVWLGTVALSRRWGLFVGVLALGGFGWLVLDHLQQAGADHHRLSDFPTHLFTMWIAAAATTELVGHYVARANAILAQRQKLLDDARERAARSEHLASLTTLAAGAAHELSTPLATIAVAARELERSLIGASTSTSVAPALVDDVRLIRQEVDRCQVILDGMSGRAGDGLPHTEPLAVDEIVELVHARLSDSQRARLRVEIAPNVARPAVAGTEAAQALTALLKNAFEASPASGEVRLRIGQHDAMVLMEVHDNGAGPSAETLRRAGEPFYTTKEPGRGLGLGLFLARTFAERAGGNLRLERDEETTAILALPALALPADPKDPYDQGHRATGKGEVTG